jgi:cell division protein FtsW
MSMEVHRTRGFDKTLAAMTLGLVTLGLVMVYSASGVTAAERFSSSMAFYVQQALGAAAGVALGLALLRVRRPFYQHPVFVLGLLVLTTGLLGLCFLMPAVARTNRWLVIPGFRFQPSELAKISLVLFLAWYLDRTQDRLDEVKPFLLPLGVLVLLVLLILREPDFGTAVLVFGLGMILFFLAGVPLRFFAIPAGLGVPVFTYYLFSSGYRIDRLLAFLSPDKNLQTINFQIAQSKLAIGSGGLLGVSLGESVQKLFFLPCAHTDFIFAIIGEELGFVGTIATIALFAVLVWRGVAVSLKAPNLFSQLAAAGLTFLIGIQALLNISVVLGLGPAKGVPLPFLSFGRSSLMMNLIAVGLLLHISQRKAIPRGSP